MSLKKEAIHTRLLQSHMRKRKLIYNEQDSILPHKPFNAFNQLYNILLFELALFAL